MLIPLPLEYREQVPLTYELWTEPPGRIESARVYRDRIDNFVAEVVLKPLARARILSGTVRAYPAIADGLLYVRNENSLVCIDLRKRPL